MASGLISRLLPTRSDSPSVYDTIREHEDNDTNTDTSDDERGRALALDERNLEEQSFNLDIEAANLDLEESRVTSQNTGFLRKSIRHGQTRTLDPGMSRAHPFSRGRKSTRLLDVEEVDDEVPASLLIEGRELGGEPTSSNPADGAGKAEYAVPSLKSPNRSTRSQWETVRENQRLHPLDAPPSTNVTNKTGKALPGLGLAHPKDKAMWRWANVENVDNYIRDVYVYYIENGVWSILLGRCLYLL